MTQVLAPHLTAWLRRAQQHPLNSRLLLSGSALIYLLCPSGRTPKDLDYAVTGDYDGQLMIESITEISMLPDDHGLLLLDDIYEMFDYTDEFPGVRAELSEHSDDGEPQPFLADFSFGDPHSLPPRPVFVPDVGPVQAVAPETLFAWKVHALVQFGSIWRPKDLYDISIMWDEAKLDRSLLPEAIELEFSSRDTELEALDALRFDDTWGTFEAEQEEWEEFAYSYAVQDSLLSFRNKIRSILQELL